MAKQPTAFNFKINDRVQFRDGRNMRVGFVAEQHPADDERPAGYSIMFKTRETNQNARARIAATDVSAGKADEFTFKIGDDVTVYDGRGEKGQAGKIVDRVGLSASPLRLEPEYGVQFKTPDGRSDLAWWGENMLAATAD